MQKRFTLILGFALPLSISLEGWSLGLGAISLGSHLDEPFHAEIVLLEADELAVSDLQIEFASSEEFARVGVNRERLSHSDSNSQSSQMAAASEWSCRVRHSFKSRIFNLSLRRRWPGGRLLKDYTVLIRLYRSRATVQSDASGPNSLRRG